MKSSKILTFSIQFAIFGVLIFLIELTSLILLKKFNKAYLATKETNCSAVEFDPFLGHRHSLNQFCNNKNIKNATIINNHWLIHTQDKEIINSEDILSKISEKKPYIIITLGGSTTDGFYTNYSNGNTWPYLLSKICQKKLRRSCVVINGGVGSYSSNQEFLKLLIYFKDLGIKPNQIVSLSGVNEKPYFSYLYDEDKKNVNPYINLHITLLEEKKKYPQLNIKESAFKTHTLLKYFATRTKNRLNTTPKREDRFTNKEYALASNNFRNNSILIYSLSKKVYDSNFSHFLQPTMLGLDYKVPPKNTSDFFIWQETIKNKPGHKEGMNKLYGYLKIDCNKLDWCFDISKELPPKGNIYADSTHPNQNGNKIISNIIAKKIFNF